VKKYIDSTITALKQNTAQICRISLEREKIARNISLLEAGADIAGLAKIARKLVEMAIEQPPQMSAAGFASPELKSAEAELEDRAMYPDEKERALHKKLRDVFKKGPTIVGETPLFGRVK
jgi:hypothetical protein